MSRQARLASGWRKPALVTQRQRRPATPDRLEPWVYHPTSKLVRLSPQDVRRQYRELFYTAPDIGSSISGAIMFKETLLQSSSTGVPFVQCLEQQGVLPGIKVDQVCIVTPPTCAAGGWQLPVLRCMHACAVERQ